MPDPLEEKLDVVSMRVHRALRMLKLNEVGAITCDKVASANDIKEYITAYAFHKRKWFNTRYDSVSSILYATRVKPPSMIPKEVDDGPDAI